MDTRFAWGAVKIIPKYYKSGKAYWLLEKGSEWKNGKRVRARQKFDTEEAAQAELNRLTKTKLRHGVNALHLSPLKLAEYVEAERIIADMGMTLGEALKMLAAYADRGTKREMVWEVVRDYLADKRQRGIRARHEQSLESALTQFATAMPDRYLTDITTQELQRWLDGRAWAWKTRKNMRGYLRALFNWAVSPGQKRLLKSPAAALVIGPRPRGEEITILTIAQVKALFRTCLTFRGDRIDRQRQEMVTGVPIFHPLLGFAALAVFCGIRPAEIEQLRRADIDMGTLTVVVSEAAAKTARRRPVEIPAVAVPFLHEWMRLCPEQKQLVPGGFLRLWRKLRTEAGLMPWVEDTCRHTFATMHYAQHQDLAALKQMMGHHESEETLHRHYRAVRFPDGQVVTAAWAAKFYALTPESVLIDDEQNLVIHTDT